MHEPSLHHSYTSSLNSFWALWDETKLLRNRRLIMLLFGHNLLDSSPWLLYPVLLEKSGQKSNRALHQARQNCISPDKILIKVNWTYAQRKQLNMPTTYCPHSQQARARLTWVSRNWESAFLRWDFLSILNQTVSQHTLPEPSTMVLNLLQV